MLRIKYIVTSLILYSRGKNSKGAQGVYRWIDLVGYEPLLRDRGEDRQITADLMSRCWTLGRVGRKISMF